MYKKKDSDNQSYSKIIIFTKNRFKKSLQKNPSSLKKLCPPASALG
jgi:hypothetical protein